MKFSKHSGYNKDHAETCQPNDYWFSDSSDARSRPTPALRPVRTAGIGNLMTPDYKRTKRTPHEVEQLASLFARTEYPDRDQRERLASRLGLNVRQVQVWFQNRRAQKFKKGKHAISRRAVDMSSVLLSTLIREKHQPVEQRESILTRDTGKATGASTTSSVTKLRPPTTARASVNSNEDISHLINECSGVIVLPCDSVSVGGWRYLRSLSRQYSLLAYICCEEQWVSVFVEEAGNAFKLTIPFDSIVALEIECPQASSSHTALVAGGTTQRGRVFPALETSKAVIHLSRAPLFYFQASSALRVWQPCRDWTENEQATSAYSHRLQGLSAPVREFVGILRQEIAKNRQDRPQHHAQRVYQGEGQQNTTSQRPPARVQNSVEAPTVEGLPQARGAAMGVGVCEARSFASFAPHLTQLSAQTQRHPSASIEQSPSTSSLAESRYPTFSLSDKIEYAPPGSTATRPLRLEAFPPSRPHSQLAPQSGGSLQSRPPFRIERYQGYVPAPLIYNPPLFWSMSHLQTHPRFPINVHGRFGGAGGNTLPGSTTAHGQISTTAYGVLPAP